MSVDILFGSCCCYAFATVFRLWSLFQVLATSPRLSQQPDSRRFPGGWRGRVSRLFAFAFLSISQPAETCHPVPPVSGFPTLCSRSLRRRVLDGCATICVSALRPIPDSGHSIRAQLPLDFPFVSFVWLFANDSHLWRVLQGLYLSM